MESPDFEESSDWMEKETSVLSGSHQPPSPSQVGSNRSKPTIPESVISTDPEAGGEEESLPTVPESASSADPEAQWREKEDMYANRLLPTIPEGAELQ